MNSTGQGGAGGSGAITSGGSTTSVAAGTTAAGTTTTAGTGTTTAGTTTTTGSGPGSTSSGGPASSSSGGPTSSSSSGSASSSSSGSSSSSSSGSTTSSSSSSSSSSTGSTSGGPVEDHGANCTVTGLPTTGTLTTNAKLPNPFTKLDGTALTSKSQWQCRREEIRKLAETFAYGAKPATPKTGVTGTVSSTSITVKVTDNGKSTSFTATVKLPSSGKAPYPAIVVYAGGGFGAPLDDTVVQSEGVAYINYDPYQVGMEGTPRNAKKGAFYDLYGSNSTTGLLVAWGWGVSRIIDLLETSGGSIFQADAIAVTGCSRFGKGAFIAGAFDERIPLTMPIESGTAGVPIWRGVPGEGAQSLSSAYGEQPWFGDAFNTFTNAPTKAPLDTHELVAMVAPRGLFIMDNPHIANLGPKSAHAAALAGAEVYKALGVGGNITYYSDVANGNHCSMRPEWSTPLKQNIEKYLKKTGTAAGVIKASPSASSSLATWVDWTTPTLN